MSSTDLTQVQLTIVMVTGTNHNVLVATDNVEELQKVVANFRDIPVLYFDSDGKTNTALGLNTEHIISIEMRLI